MNARALIATGIVCATALTIASLITNAGPLNPPAGPIAPTNKTLQEVEPRIAVNAENTPGDADSLFKITQPGSYYLTGNITGVAGKHGIEIDSNNVTLDLSGFALIGVADSLHGIKLRAVSGGGVIRNGIVSDWDGNGVEAAFDNGAIENVHAHRNNGWGIDSGGSSSSRITGCNAQFNGVFAVVAAGGIRAGASATIESCQARDNIGNGIVAGRGSTISGNAASNNSGAGIFASNGATVTGNSAWDNSGFGIVASASSTVAGNTVRANRIAGIQVSSDSLVLNNACDRNGLGIGDGAGILATGGDNRIEGNTVTNNDRGIDVDGPGNLIIGNSASGNTVNYDIAADNRYGPIIDITATGTPAVAGSAAAGTVSTTDPWANFSF